jgi:hypothetical protein
MTFVTVGTEAPANGSSTATWTHMQPDKKP